MTGFSVGASCGLFRASIAKFECRGNGHNQQPRFDKLSDQAFAPSKARVHRSGPGPSSDHDGRPGPATEGLLRLSGSALGAGVKNFIDIGAGVVDEDYRGKLDVVLSIIPTPGPDCTVYLRVELLSGTGGGQHPERDETWSRLSRLTQ